MQEVNKAVLIEPRSPVIDFFNIARMPLLGLPILGAMLRKMGLRVKIFCERLAPINWQEVAEADLVGISVLTNLAPRAYEIAEKVKAIASQAKRKIFLVMGGPHPSFLPEEVLSHRADFVVRHEGEDTLRELVEYLQGAGSRDLDEIRGLSYWDGAEMKHNPDRPFIKDLDVVSPPDFSLIEGSERINFVPLQTSRGCPYDCEFCSVVQMYGRKVRRRSSESVIEELERLQRVMPGKHVFAVDDNFSALPETLVLLEEMARSGIKLNWSTQERISVARKEENLKLMRRTGCARLYIGIESFNPDALKEWGKGQTPEQIREGISVIHRHGFLIHGMFILGADADTPETIRHTVDSALRYGIDTAQFFILVPPPGTRLYQRFKQAGRILDGDWSHYDGQHVVFGPEQMTPWQLQELAIEAYQRFYTFWQGVKWAVRGRLRNSFFAFYGRWLNSKWLKENQRYLADLRRRWAGY